MSASLFSLLRERNFPRAVGGSKKTERCSTFMNKSAPTPPPPTPPLHTHTHTCKPIPYTQPSTAVHTRTVACGGSPAAGEPVRPPACRTAADQPEPSSRPAWPCGRLPATKNRSRAIKISTFQMVPQYYYNTPMGSKMPSNHTRMHFCAFHDLLQASCQGKLL